MGRIARASPLSSPLLLARGSPITQLGGTTHEWLLEETITNPRRVSTTRPRAIQLVQPRLSDSSDVARCSDMEDQVGKVA